MLWLTSTLSTLSSAISKVRRLMKPVLCTTRMLVTSVSVVQRWNQALKVRYSAAMAATAAHAQQNSISAGTITRPDATSRIATTIQTPIAGR